MQTRDHPSRGGERGRKREGHRSSYNRPFPSSPQPPFQSEAECEVFILKVELFTITKILHLDSL
ncbi:hypothetical protein P5673_024314 [Acropora cervicornis]|uniref:Uncharacterized protein n=1 Tax=Acropora cervicornis TaxID=6130 RepID=A0AAD9Q4P3_ACRCE|nr:hypothetical protein P5673_024314 [Acropora cervicornis]